MARQGITMEDRALQPTSKSYKMDDGSIQIIQSLNVHKTDRELKEIVHDITPIATQTCMSNRGKITEGMTREEFLEGMMFEGEKLLGSDKIKYDWVTFVPFNESETQPKKENMPKGQIYLTNHRMLLLSTDEGQGLNFTPNKFGKTNKYNLRGGCFDKLHYQCVPMGCIKSVEYNASLDLSTSADISGRKKLFGGKSWSKAPFRIENKKERKIIMGAALPPWGFKYEIRIYADETITIENIRAFIRDLQQFAPGLYPKVAGSLLGVAITEQPQDPGQVVSIQKTYQP